ncbi:MAG: hypothetical protein ACK46X_03580 [Candidatus Sericytochromatia bacterium]
MTHFADVRPLPGTRLWDEAATARLEDVLTGFLSGVNTAYFMLMWVVVAYEAAMMVGVPILFPAIKAGLLTPVAVKTLYLTAAKGHTYLLPAVIWFLLYQGLPALDRR